MFEFRRYDINRFWFLLVLVQLLMSVVASFAMQIPFGSVITLMIVWFFCDFCLTGNTQYKGFSKKLPFLMAGLCAASVAVLAIIPYEYQSGYLHKWLLIAFFFYICYIEKREVIATANIRTPDPFIGGLILLISPLAFSVGYFVNSISMLFVDNTLTQSMEYVNDNLIGSMIVLAILPALTEEILFRGYIYNGFSGRKRVVISAVLFALLHMNFNQMSYAFVIGLLLALILWYTGNSIYSMIMHVTFNAINVLSVYSPCEKVFTKVLDVKIAGCQLFCPSVLNDAGTFDPVSGMGSLLITLIYLVIILCVLRFAKKKAVLPEGEEQILWKPNLSFAAGTAICLIVAVLYEIA